MESDVFFLLTDLYKDIRTPSQKGRVIFFVGGKHLPKNLSGFEKSGIVSEEGGFEDRNTSTVRITSSAGRGGTASVPAGQQHDQLIDHKVEGVGQPQLGGVAKDRSDCGVLVNTALLNVCRFLWACILSGVFFRLFVHCARKPLYRVVMVPVYILHLKNTRV